MKIYQLFFLFLLINCMQMKKLHAKTPEKVIIYTLPKSGTHFIRRFFQLAGIKNHIQHLNHHRIELYDHKCIITLRDPRDYFCSLKNWQTYCVCTGRDVGQTREACERYLSLSENEKLLCFLELNTKIMPYPINYILMPFETATANLQNENVLISYFEDYIGVGPHSISKKQIDTIEEWLNFFGYYIPREQIEDYIRRAWGTKSETYFPGKKIGRWRQEMTPYLESIFMKHWGHHLMDWGYEN